MQKKLVTQRQKIYQTWNHLQEAVLVEFYFGLDKIVKDLKQKSFFLCIWVDHCTKSWHIVQNRWVKHPLFSIFGQKCRDLSVFLGKSWWKNGNLACVEHLTNSTSEYVIVHIVLDVWYVKIKTLAHKFYLNNLLLIWLLTFPQVMEHPLQGLQSVQLYGTGKRRWRGKWMFPTFLC